MSIFKIKRAINFLLATSIFWSTCMTGLVHARQIEMISTETVMLQATQDTRAELHALLNRQDIQSALVDAGVSVDEAIARVDTLTSVELAEIQTQLDELPAGAGVGSIVGAAVFIFVVLLITDILGFTDVFSFVKK